MQTPEEFIRQHLDDELWPAEQAIFAVKLAARDAEIAAEAARAAEAEFERVMGPSFRDFGICDKVIKAVRAGRP